MDSLTEELCRELRRFLRPHLVRCYKDTIDYKRLDTYVLMERRNKKAWSVYYTGSLWIDESKESIGAGDIVIPIEKEEAMVKKLHEFSCAPEFIHRHPEFGTSHVHLSNCPIKNRVRDFAKLISEGV
jgi:hypothetical protein